MSNEDTGVAKDELDEIEVLLVGLARNVAQWAYAPYSGRKMGAAVLTAEDEIFTGCNVENSTLGLSVCAVASAIAQAVAEGKQTVEGGGKAKLKLKKVVDFSNAPVPRMPCGHCRQVIAEFASDDVMVIAANLEGGIDRATIVELLPKCPGL